MKVRFFLRSILALFLFNQGINTGVCQYSQSLLPTLSPQTPSTAALTKFNDHEVNLFNGSVDISIPLYEINVKGVSVPVILRYHSSGIKVTDRAGWVGLGWALETGGQISRRVMGGSDEGSNGYLNNTIEKTSTLDVYDANDRNYLSMVKWGTKDVEPDIFSYSFLGKAGKFIFDRSSGNTVVAKIPFTPIKIQYYHNQRSDFEITDEFGNFLVFGKNNKELTTVSNGGTESQTTSSWLLEKIKLPNKSDSIYFTYSSISGTIANEGIESLVVSDNVVVQVSPQIYYPDPGTTSFKSYNVYVTEKKTNEIFFPGGKVQFVQSSSPREDISGDFKSLSSIRIYKKMENDPYQMVKEYKFVYGYFINGTDNQSKRLRLDRLELYDQNNSKLNSYSFDYHTNISLPNYNSWAKDYWGYYNGKPNSSLIPRMQIPYNQSSIWIGSNIANGREPDSVFMKAGVLERIHYPTGGISEFKFETNRYFDNGNIKLAGGLRIKEIKTYEKSGSDPLTRKFEYNLSRPNFQLSNYYFQTSQTFRYYRNTSSMGYGLANSKRVRSFFATPTIDIVPFDGSIVVYPKVTEYIQGGNIQNGKIEYEFRDRADAMLTASFIGRPVFNSYFYERGQIKKKTEYKSTSGNGYSRVKETEFAYSYYPDTWYNHVGLVVSKNAVNDGIVGFDADIDPGFRQEEASSWQFSNYSISSDDNYPISKTETYFDNNNPFVVSTHFKYDNIVHQQVTKKEVTESNKKRLEFYVYPQDFPNSPGTFISEMVSNHQIAYPIEKITAVDNNGTITIVDGVLTRYKAGGQGLIDEVSRLETLNPLASSSFKFSNKAISTIPPSGTNSMLVPDSRYKKAIKYDTYNSFGNPLQYTSIGEAKTSYVWAYNGQYPIAETKNASQNQVSHTSFETGEKGGWTYAGTPVVAANSRTGRKYYNLGTGNITKTTTGASAANPFRLTFWARRSSGTGNWTFMEKTESLSESWKLIEREVKDAMVTISGSGIFVDELRLHPAHAQMATYTHDPNIGITSSTDIRNQTVYYEYDGIGRLKTIKNEDGHILEHYEYNYSTGN